MDAKVTDTTAATAMNLPPMIAPTDGPRCEATIRRLLAQSGNLEVTIQGPHASARLCIYKHRLAWIRKSDHPEQLGDVLRRELGLSRPSLEGVIEHCKAHRCLFGEGVVALGLASPAELRECLRRHFSDQLWELLTWSGPLSVEEPQHPHRPHRPYRYDTWFTFDLDELLERPALPSGADQAALAGLLARCRDELAQLSFACVIEPEEGLVLSSLGDDGDGSLDLLGLCVASLRRLLHNRLTRNAGGPSAVALTFEQTHVVAHTIPGRPGWLLVVGGQTPTGLLLSACARLVASECPVSVHPR